MSVTFTIPPCYVEHLCSRCPDCGLGPKIYPLDAKGKPIMPEETKDTPAEGQRGVELAALVAEIFRVTQELNIYERHRALKAAIELNKARPTLSIGPDPDLD